jgi:aspartyl-tRNA(Asn)/glutamyl-tRNA(Gln) amidotransferase subunit A
VSDPLNIFITRCETSGSRRCGVKDLFHTAGVRTTYGSRIYGDHVPTKDAIAWQRLAADGWTMAGKTNMHEFAYGTSSQNPWYGTVGNPHDPGRVAGGSSGGSAAGIVTGEFEMGLGTDTAGSIRIPASWCGVVGFKP